MKARKKKMQKEVAAGGARSRPRGRGAGRGRTAKLAQLDLFGEEARETDAGNAEAQPAPAAETGRPAGIPSPSILREGDGPVKRERGRKAPEKRGRRKSTATGDGHGETAHAGDGVAPRNAGTTGGIPAPAESRKRGNAGEAPATAAREEAKAPRRRESAESLGRRQREISVAEFFQKNRHLLGFDNPAKALLTATKEAVDNSLDACEEAGILPELDVRIDELAEDRFRLAVTDNGPGIVRGQIPRIFGKLLYGSKFHTLRQSRGQQGIGISAAGMYSQLTTGQPVRITSRTGKGRPAHYFEIAIDTARNEPKVLTDREVEWDREHGTRVEMDLAGTYKKGRRSVDDYVAQTALANPHAAVRYRPPKGDEFLRERLTRELPREPLAIKPHPYGVELGALIALLRSTRGRTLKSALQADFARVSDRVAEEICRTAGLNPDSRPKSLGVPQAEALFRAIPKVRIMAPPTSAIVPIGEELILEGLRKTVAADFYTSTSRPPAVYRGNPFLVEAGLAYGGSMPVEEPIDLWRFANRVPLQYQQSACAVTRAVLGTDWRKYGIQQPKGALPLAPMVLFVHVASVWVPFTSESKEAIASYPEIIRELRLGLQEIGRRLGGFLRHRMRLAEAEKKKSYIRSYIPHIGIALREILNLTAQQEAKVVSVLTDTLERSRKT